MEVFTWSLVILIPSWISKSVLEIVGLEENIEVRITAIGTEFILGRSIIDRYCVLFDHGERVIIER
jgi:hypothetical protein